MCSAKNMCKKYVPQNENHIENRKIDRMAILILKNDYNLSKICVKNRGRLFDYKILSVFFSSKNFE